MKTFTIILLAFIICNCAVPFKGLPDTEEINATDCGPPINTSTLAAISYEIKQRLKDPESARIRIGTPRKGAWGDVGGLLISRNIVFGWIISVGVNAKNSYGGYGGEKIWTLCYRNNILFTIYN